MFKSKVFWLTWLISLTAFAQAAEINKWVMLDNHPAHPTRILAKYKQDALLNVSSDTMKQIGSKVQRRYKLVPGLVVLEETDTVALANVSTDSEEAQRRRLLGRIEALKKSGLFEYVEPDYIVHAYLTPTDQAFVDGTLWGLQNLGQNAGTPGADIAATTAWDITTGSTNVVVAVIDTGIRYTHDELVNQMWRNPGETAGDGVDDDNNGFVDDVFGINAITGTGNPFDDNDHGTHVSGTIGAAANDGHPHVGVTWNVQLMGCKFLNAAGFGATSDAIICIDYAVAKGARILNNSWGGGPFDQALFDAINRARTKGVLFVVAAGNSANNNDLNPDYPASYQLDNIIVVAAIDRHDKLASFSNFGVTTVHLGAPGVEIYSSTAASDSAYSVFEGTSMAAPHVSGVAALILSHYPGADLDEIRGRILGGTVSIPALVGKTIKGGRVNAYNSLTLAGTGVLQVSVDPPSGSTLLRGTAQAIFVKVKDLFSVVNATVTGTLADGTKLTFTNDGQPPDVLAGDAIYSALLQVPDSLEPVIMTLEVSAPGKVGFTNVITYTIVLPPTNDNFADAIKVPPEGDFIKSNNRFATIELGEPKHAGVSSVAASLWWIWLPANNTNVFIDTTGSAIDSVVAVYTGNSLTNLQQVAATNNVGPRAQAYLSFDAKAGTAYRIVVASADTNSVGSIQVRIAPGGQLDTTSPIVSITSPPSGLPVTTKIIRIAGTAFDPAPNSSGVQEVLVNVNRGIASPAVGTTNWSASILLRQGVNAIEVRAIDATGNLSAPATMQLNYFPNDPINDVFANAILLTKNAGTDSANNSNGTKEAGEPLHAGKPGGKSIWWTWIAPSDGVLFLSTTNSTFDTLLGLYTGAKVNALTTIGGNDDAFETSKFSKLAQAVHGGTTYRIAVDGFDGTSGVASLTYSFTPSGVFNLDVSHTLGGTVVPTSGMVESNATIVLSAVPEPNFEFAGWEGAVISKENPLSVIVTGNLSLTARFALRAVSDDFETGDFSKQPFTFAGAKPWIVQTNSTSRGKYGARSGTITDGEASSLILVTKLREGVAGFDYRVSSEREFDFLDFYLNGQRLLHVSGEVGWFPFQFNVLSGTNTFEWRYVKDAFGSSGLDMAFIDNLDLTVSVPVDNTPVRLALERLIDGRIRVQVQGQVNQQYVIQASANLLGWLSISTNTATQGIINFIDPEAPALPLRFYRAVVP